MNRILVIDQDRAAMETLGLACLPQGIGVAMADNVCEGVRVLLGESVSLVLVDEHELRFGPRDSATLFERVAGRYPNTDVPAHAAPPPEPSLPSAIEGAQAEPSASPALTR